MNEELILGTSSKGIKMDLLRFKDDILKDMRNIELGLNKKYFKVEESIKEKINSFELKINSLSQKIIELSNLIHIDNSIKEKVESFEQFKEEIRDTIFKRRAKFNEFEKNMNDEIDRINNILTDSVIYPGVIGPSTKFKTFHEYMDYLLTEINQLSIIKEKRGLDLTPFKMKIENTIDAFRIQINNLCSKEYTFNAIAESEKQLKNLINIYDDRLKNIKVENINNSKKIVEMNKQIENLLNFKYRLENTENEHNYYNSEFIIIKNEIKNINDILKELMSNYTKKENEKKSLKIYSGVKQYINGHLNANELSSMKKFTYEKKNSNGIINDKLRYSINNSPFPSPSSSNKMRNSNETNKKRNNLPEGTNLFMNIDNNNNNNEENNFFISQRNSKSELKNINELIQSKNKEENINNKKENIKNDLFFEISNFDNKQINEYKEKENFMQESNNYNKITKKEMFIKYNNSFNNTNTDSDKCIIKEEDEKFLSNNNNNSMKNINLAYLSKNNDKNNIQINNNLIKEKITIFSRLNNSYENNIKNDNLNQASSRNFNLSKNNNFSHLFKPYKIELPENKSPIFLESNEIKSLKNGYIQNKYKNEEKSENINISNKKNTEIKNKTYTNFPKLNKELSDNKIKILQNTTFQSNNHNSFRNINNIGEYSNSDVKVAGYIKKPKKILLTNPDNIPSNRIIRKNKRNKTMGFKTENNREKYFKKIYDEVEIKNNKVKNKNLNKLESYASLYQLITSHEESFKKKKKQKNKNND